MRKILLFIAMLSIFVLSCGKSKEFYVDVANNAEVPEITLTTFDGEKVSSNSILKNGKPTLFVVAAEWCSHCQAESPSVQEFYDKYKDDVNVVVIYSNANTNLENSVKFVKDNGYTYPTYFDADGTILRGFGIEGFPFNLRIDNGKVTKALELPVNFEKLEKEFIEKK